VEKNGASKHDGTNIQMKIGYSNRPDFAPAAAGRGKQNQANFFVFSPLFFSFPCPPRRAEKNCASKRDGTKIQMKIGYSKRPDFAPAAAGRGKQNQACKLFLGRYNLYLPP
jgi:hypothetical protein